MSAAIQTKRMSAEEYFDWLDRSGVNGKQYELNRGEVVERPSPGEIHGVICFLIIRLLGNYVFQRGRGYLCTNDTGLLVERNPDTVRGPDVMLFDETCPLDQLSRRFTERIPKLAVEVLSPGDQMTKVNRRLSQLLRRGVALVWLVDPEVRSITVYRPGKDHTVLDETDEITGEDVLPDLRYRVTEFFALPGQ